MMLRRWFQAFAFGAVVFAVVPVAAQGIELQAEFSDWRVFTFIEDGNTGCFIYSEATSSTANGIADRGKPSLQVTRRRWMGRDGEVSVRLGFAADTAAPLSATVAGAPKINLFAEGSTAWAREDKDDRQLIQAMRAGLVMMVEAQALGGGRATDEFSLRGFTSAYKKMDELCP